MKILKFKILITILSIIVIVGQVLPLKVIAADYEEVYETVEDYLKVYYYEYENIDKREITSIHLDSLDRCSIKDFSGIYEYPNLTSLYFLGFEVNLNLDLSKLPKLKELTISMGNIQGIECTEEKSLEILKFFGSEIPQCNLSKLTLKELNMEYCQGEIAKNIREIEKLIIENHGFEENSVLDLSFFEDLKVLRVSPDWGGFSYTIKGLDKLENLEELSLYDVNIKDNELKEILKKLSKLNRLELGNKASEPKDVSKLGIESLKNLNGLVLANVSCQDNIVSNLTNLRSLSLSNIYNLDSENQKEISKMEINKLENLEELNLYSVIVSENDILSNLSSLRNLSLSSIYEDNLLTRKDISNLKINELKNLKKLELAEVIIKENNILSNFSNLTILNLFMVYEEGGKTLKDISKLEINKLEKLQEFRGDFVNIR